MVLYLNERARLVAHWKGITTAYNTIQSVYYEQVAIDRRSEKVEQALNACREALQEFESELIALDHRNGSAG